MSKTQKKVELLALAYVQAKAEADKAETIAKDAKDALVALAGIGAQIEIDTDLGLRIVKIDEQTQSRFSTAEFKTAMPDLFAKFSNEITFTIVRIVKSK